MILTLILWLFLAQELSCNQTQEFNQTIPEFANWTSCWQFLKDVEFDPKSVIDIDWQVFYLWNYDFSHPFHVKFSTPSEILIDRFKVELDDITPSVNWSNAELFLETDIDVSGLLIRTKKPGEYRFVSSILFEYTSRRSTLPFGLKISMAGYFGFMNCKLRIAYALAPVQKLPNATCIEEAAKSIGFQNPYGRSYLDLQGETTQPAENDFGDDAEDDEQLDIDRKINTLRIF